MPARARTILDITAVVILLWAAVYLGVHYAALPQRLNAHINGVPAHARSKQFAWLPIGVGVWSVVLLSFVSWILKDGTPMDDRLLRTPVQIEAARAVFSWMKVVISGGIALFTYSTVRQLSVSHSQYVAAYLGFFIIVLVSPVVALIMQVQRRRELVG
jgi:hypothetical protein